MQQQLELLTLRADAEPSSIDEAARTVRVTWSTGAPVRRRDYEGEFAEALSLDPGHVRLDRLIGGSVLDSHKQYGLDNVLGVVTAAGIDHRGAWADLKFSRRAGVEPIWQDIRDGVLRSVSVGYSVAKWNEQRDPTTGARTRTAIDWTPREISLVAVPADSGAHVRKETTMTTETGAAPALDNRAETNQAIRSIAAAAGLDTTFADGLIDTRATIEQARAAAFEALVQRGGGSIQTQRVEIGQDHDDPRLRIERMAEALDCRSRGGKPSDPAAPYMGRTLLDMAAELLTLRGERIGMLSRDQIYARAISHSTSDFPNLLTATGNRVLMAAFQAAPNPLKQLARQTTINDFRAKSVLKLGAMGQLEKVNENGEITYTTRAEAKEGYSLSTFARLFSLSRQAIINDDLGAFNDWSTAMGRAAAETEAAQLVALLTANSNAGVTMDDGKALFHADHDNLADSGAAIDVDTLSAGRQAMREQTDLDGKTLINTTPKFLLVSPAKETEGEKVLASLAPVQTSDVNPFTGKLGLLVEPRLSGNGWYLFADPAVQAVLEYAYLTSAQGPQLASREGWDVLGMEFRVVLDFGCGAIDHRGAYRNPGA